MRASEWSRSIPNCLSKACFGLGICFPIDISMLKSCMLDKLFHFPIRMDDKTRLGCALLLKRESLGFSTYY